MDYKICDKKELCTGCMACKEVCPQNCIRVEVEEDGFSYPLIDKIKCSNCGLCKKTCPVNNSPNKNNTIKGYVARYKNEAILEDSTSGGSFTAFADYVFSVDGFLVGVVYDEDMNVIHQGILKEKQEDVSKMRGSKYVQSDLKDVFYIIKEKLHNNKLVCFSGTPCQVAGLKSYLGKDYDNLMTIDLVCHGVGSPLLFRKYIEYMENRYNSKVIDVKFRNKTYGYHSGTMRVDFENGKRYFGSGRIDYMSKAFFKEASSRQSCYECPFRGKERYGDFTVFDSWHIEQLIPDKKDDDKGYTNLYVNTEKGLNFLQNLKGKLELWEADIDNMRELDGVMIENDPVKFNNRDELLSELNGNDFAKTMQKYLPVSKKDKLLELSKRFLYKTGVLSILKKVK